MHKTHWSCPTALSHIMSWFGNLQNEAGSVYGVIVCTCLTLNIHKSKMGTSLNAVKWATGQREAAIQPVRSGRCPSPWDCHCHIVLSFICISCGSTLICHLMSTTSLICNFSEKPSSDSNQDESSFQKTFFKKEDSVKKCVVNLRN